MKATSLLFGPGFYFWYLGVRGHVEQRPDGSEAVVWDGTPREISACDESMVAAIRAARPRRRIAGRFA